MTKHAPRTRFSSLAYASSDDLMFALAPDPATCGFDVKIGAGEVRPEIDFALPVMPISAKTWLEVQRQYREMTKGALTRAVRLNCTSLAIEIEHLYEMTIEPKWGADLTKQVKTIMEEF